MKYEIIMSNKKFVVDVDDNSLEVLEKSSENKDVFDLPDFDFSDETNANETNVIRASLPGTIVDISCNVGDEISMGEILLKIESMKMENDIASPFCGKISDVKVKKGQSVTKDQELIVISSCNNE